MKLFACEVLLVLSVASCSSSGEGEPAIDASVGVDASDAPPIDGPPSARNAKAVGAWAVSTHVTVCGGFDKGLVGTALTNDNQFLVVFKEQFPDGTYPQTMCTFTTDTAFTCADFSKSGNFGGCVISGSFSNIEGTITGTAFEIAGDGRSTASAQCPGGFRTCGPSVSSAVGTIAP